MKKLYEHFGNGKTVKGFGSWFYNCKRKNGLFNCKYIFFKLQNFLWKLLNGMLWNSQKKIGLK